MKLKAYQIRNHGIEHNQYFQGCSASFTTFAECVTGCGGNTKEAYEDAVEQIYQSHPELDKSALPSRPPGITVKERVTSKHTDEHYAYVSILFTVEA